MKEFLITVLSIVGSISALVRFLHILIDLEGLGWRKGAFCVDCEHWRKYHWSDECCRKCGQMKYRYTVGRPRLTWWGGIRWQVKKEN